MKEDSPERIEEARLIEEARRGDTNAFGQLYELLAPSIFRFFYSRMEDRLDAEDLTEEVFLRAWRYLPRYREQGAPFNAFLFRIAHNILTDHYRRAKREGYPSRLDHEEFVAVQTDPSEMMANNLRAKEIRKALEKLQENYRTVLSLRFLSDLSVNETAQIIQKSPEAIRVMQHRALAALQKLLIADQVHQ